MQAYFCDQALKDEFVARMQAHILADEVIQGTSFDNGRGCAVGCTYDEYDHSLGPSRLGFPEWYEHLRGTIFEGLPNERNVDFLSIKISEAQKWAYDSLNVVKPGVDLEKVKYAVALGSHRRALKRLENNTEPYAQECRDAIQGVIDWIISGASPSTASIAARSAASAASAEHQLMRDDLIAAIENL
jgi:hypothetical protein